MSKEIYLYSKDKKYRCAIELADACDRFGCPDHSMLILTEERPNGTYVIAQAKDKILETEKDKQIAELKQQLEEKNADIIALDTDNYSFKQQIDNLRQQLKSQPAEIIDEIKKQMDARKLEYISHLTKKHCYGLRIDRIFEILDAILKEYQK